MIAVFTVDGIYLHYDEHTNMAGGTQMVFVRFVVNGGIDINNEESNMTTALTALVMKISVSNMINPVYDVYIFYNTEKGYIHISVIY